MSNSTALLPALDMAVAAPFPFYYSPRASLVDWMTDANLSLLAPIVAYWAMSLIFVVFDFSNWKWLERYRLHESKEVTSRNRATMPEVVRAVILQQLIQTALGYVWMDEPAESPDHLHEMQRLLVQFTGVFNRVAGPKTAGAFVQLHGSAMAWWTYWWIIPTAQFLLAIFILDTWEYFVHRAMHQNKYLYRKFHSVHHRLYVPYAFGALYNHWVEGFVMDSLGAALAHALSGITIRQAIGLFAFSTMKTVDDHCGYRLPFDPFQIFFPNNAAYHDIHHQAWGIKHNFSQPFYIHWDTILGTRYNGPKGKESKPYLEQRAKDKTE